jgi:hypothetical protein
MEVSFIRSVVEDNPLALGIKRQPNFSLVIEGHEKFLMKQYETAIGLYIKVLQICISLTWQAGPLGLQSCICTYLLQYMFKEALILVESCFGEKSLSEEHKSALQSFQYLAESNYRTFTHENEHNQRAVELIVALIYQFMTTGKLSIPSPLSFRFYSQKETRLVKTVLGDKSKLDKAVNDCQKWSAQTLVEYMLLLGKPADCYKCCVDLGYWKHVIKEM